MNRNKRKNLEELLMIWVMRLAVGLIVGVLLMILFSILYRGLPSMSWSMISETPKGGYYYGKEGGVLNAIIGSLYLAVGATLLAIVIGLPVALYMNVYARRQQRMVHAIRFFLDLLWGIPSIVYGAFGFSLMIMVGMKTSLMAGIITVGLFILPIMIRAIDEVLQSVSGGLFEASLSLGATRTQTAYKVFLRQGLPGVVTAVLLSFGRAIGDAAAVLFTTGYTDHIPTSPDQPAATLPLAIFFQLSSPIKEVQDRAYAAALILTAIILIISISARLLSKRFDKHRIKF
jgi:phosphate transport system permease protein